MADYDMRCSVIEAREYVKSEAFGVDSVKKALPGIVCAALMTAMPIIGIIGFIMTKNAMMLILVACAVVLSVGIGLFMHFLINGTASKLAAAYGESEELICSVSDDVIVIVRDNKPVRTVGWSSITELREGKTAFFIKEGDSGLMILGKDKLMSGSLQETSEIIARKLGERG